MLSETIRSLSSLSRRRTRHRIKLCKPDTRRSRPSTEVRRPSVNIMQSHLRFHSRTHQTSRCLQHEIILFANFHSQLRFLFCVVDADCHARVMKGCALAYWTRITLSIHAIDSRALRDRHSCCSHFEPTNKAGHRRREGFCAVLLHLPTISLPTVKFQP